MFVSNTNVTNIRYLEIAEQNYTEFLGELPQPHRLQSCTGLAHVYLSSQPLSNLASDHRRRPAPTGNYIYSIEKSNGQCDEQNVTFCVSSVEEIEKCLDLAKVALVRRVGPFIRCLGKFTQDECIDEVRAKRADLINLDPFQFYNATR